MKAAKHKASNLRFAMQTWMEETPSRTGGRGELISPPQTASVTEFHKIEMVVKEIERRMQQKL